MTEPQNPWTPPEQVPITRPASAETPAGWYPDGVGPRLRYWDGRVWTEHFAEPEAAQPEAAQPDAVPSPAVASGYGQPYTAQPVRPPTPMHPAVLAALLIGGLTLVTILVVIIVYFVGVPTAPIPRIHPSTGASSLPS